MQILKLKCVEDQRDSLEVMEQNEEQVAVCAISDCEGYTDEVVCYLERDGVEQLYRWLGEWLGVLGI